MSTQTLGDITNNAIQSSIQEVVNTRLGTGFQVHYTKNWATLVSPTKKMRATCAVSMIDTPEQIVIGLIASMNLCD